jgi:hypothetical protein
LGLLPYHGRGRGSRIFRATDRADEMASPGTSLALGRQNLEKVTPSDALDEGVTNSDLKDKVSGGLRGAFKAGFSGGHLGEGKPRRKALRRRDEGVRNGSAACREFDAVGLTHITVAEDGGRKGDVNFSRVAGEKDAKEAQGRDKPESEYGDGKAQRAHVSGRMMAQPYLLPVSLFLALTSAVSASWRNFWNSAAFAGLANVMAS